MFEVKYTFLEAFSHENLTFFGGSAKDLAIASPWDMVINFSNDPNLFLKINLELFPKEFKNFGKFLAKESNIPQLSIPWPDMDLPKLSPDAWVNLVKDIQLTFKGKKRANIAVCCGWGSGRTGTALAIFKALLTKSRKDPVESIRETYSKMAVETDTQVSYVEFVTGIMSKTEGSMTVTKTTPSKSINVKSTSEVEVSCELCSTHVVFDPSDEDRIEELIDDGWYFTKDKVLCPIHGIGLESEKDDNDEDGAPY